MALQTATPTDVPRNADLTLARPTWAEGVGDLAKPVGYPEGAGYSLASELASSHVNYSKQDNARWDRAASIDRAVFSSEGLFTTCATEAAVFNDGAGTLNITLKPLRIVVDYGPNPAAASAPDGGVVLELFTPAGAPETLPASSDCYVDVAEDGTVTVTSVPNLDPAPVLALGFVRFYILVTDLIELVSADLAPGVAPFVCLGPTTGAANIQATNIDAATLGASTASVGDLTVGGAAVVDAAGSLTVENGATSSLLGNVALGTAPGDTIAALGTLTTELRAHAGVNIDGDDLTGTVDSTATVGTVAMQNSGTGLPSAERATRWTDTFLAARVPGGVVRAVPIPARGAFIAAFSTANAIADTGATAAIRLAETEMADIEFAFQYRHTSNLEGTMDTRVQVTGPLVVEVNVISTQIDPVAAGPGWRTAVIGIRWKPDDSFVGPGLFTYLFELRAGTNLGVNLELRNIRPKVVSAFEL